MWLLFDPLQHVSFHLAYTAIKQVVYCSIKVQLAADFNKLTARRERDLQLFSKTPTHSYI